MSDEPTGDNGPMEEAEEPTGSSEPMGAAEEPAGDPGSMEVTSDDRLWTLLTYVLSPLVPIIILLLEDKRDRPFIRAHNAQALVMGLINVVISILIGWLVFPLCLNLLIWVLMIYWGIQAYQGKLVNIPVVSDFVKNQGWA